MCVCVCVTHDAVCGDVSVDGCEDDEGEGEAACLYAKVLGAR